MRQLLYPIVLGSLVLACGGGEKVETVVIADDTTGTGGGGGATTTTTTTTTTGPGGPGGTTGAGTSDNSGTTGGEVDTGGTTGFDPNKAPKCGIEDGQGLAIGEACAENADCQTGVCYGEALWNEDGSTEAFKFCTAGCSGCTIVGSCNEWDKAAGISENTCMIFTSNFINYYELVFDSVCLATCLSDGDCVGLAPFTKCALIRFGKESNYGVRKVCQPPEFPELDDKDFNQ